MTRDVETGVFRVKFLNSSKNYANGQQKHAPGSRRYETGIGIVALVHESGTFGTHIKKGCCYRSSVN